MIKIKNKKAIQKMSAAGNMLANLFVELADSIVPGISTLDIDTYVSQYLEKHGMVSQTRGYKGYKHASCVSVNEEVVHGVPNASKVLKAGDLVKVDVCASLKGYCADMARCFVVEHASKQVEDLVEAARHALKEGIQKAVPGNYVSDISASIQEVVESCGYGVVRDFAGHGIGKHMHEEPEVLNYGAPGKGPKLRAGMTLAIEPMITMGGYLVYIDKDGWTVKTKDASLAAHVEDTIVVTDQGPKVLTQIQQSGGQAA